jgi:sec-independent protein translocase protein TatA
MATFVPPQGETKSKKEVTMFGLSIQELMIVGVVAVLLFGKKLPEVAGSLGKSYTQFRRGLQDIQSEMNQAVNTTDNHEYGSDRDSTKALTYSDDDDYDEPTAPKFTPPSESA